MNKKIKIFTLMIIIFLAITFFIKPNNTYSVITLDSAQIEVSQAEFVGQLDSNTNQYIFRMYYDDSSLSSNDLRTIIGYVWSINSLNDLVYIIDLQSTMTLFYGSTEIFVLNPKSIIFNTGLTLSSSYVQFLSSTGSILTEIPYSEIHLSANKWEINWLVEIVNFEQYYLGYDTGFNLGREQGYIQGYNIGYEIGLNQGELSGYSLGQSDGYALGLSEGLIAGYNNGYEDGITENNIFGIHTFISYGWIIVQWILTVEIWPSFYLGYVLLIPLGFSLLLFFLKWKKGS